MALVCPDLYGEILLLQYIVGLVEAGNPVLHLYANDVTPSDSTVVGDLIEATSSGYAAITLVSSNWTTTQTAGVTTAVYSERTFSFGTDAVCYGYYVTDAFPWVINCFKGSVDTSFSGFSIERSHGHSH